MGIDLISLGQLREGEEPDFLALADDEVEVF